VWNHAITAHGYRHAPRKDVASLPGPRAASRLLNLLDIAPSPGTTREEWLSVDWLETSDTFASGDTMTPELVEAFLKTIDCYVMGS
jgi:hypothetical protein